MLTCLSWLLLSYTSQYIQKIIVVIHVNASQKIIDFIAFQKVIAMIASHVFYKNNTLRLPLLISRIICGRS
jgi:hypothetical protein